MGIQFRAGFMGCAADWAEVKGMLPEWQTLSASALVGYSMGGRLALRVALEQPEELTHLVLESASPGLETAEQRAARVSLDEERAMEIERDFESFLDDWYRRPLFAGLRKSRGFEAMLARRRKNDPAALARSLREMGTGAQPSFWDRLGELTMPVMLIVGEHDAKFVDIARRMAERIADVRLEIVPGCWHVPHAEAPGAFVALLREFLQ